MPVLVGGTSEAVAGGNGLKVGAARVKPGQPIPASAQASVCKAALYRQWQQLVAALHSLACSGGQEAAQQAQVSAPGTADEAVAAPQEAAAAASRSPAEGLSYRAAKQAAGAAYAAVWQALLRPPSPLEGWIPKPPELEGFVL